MDFATEPHPPIWQKTQHLTLPRLHRDLEVDVCIIGAGIAGLTTAYHLLKRGLKVAVLERRDLNMGETGHTSAHLTNALDDGFQRLKSIYGLEGLKTAYRSHAMAIDDIQSICNSEGIHCEFRRVDGYLFLDSQTDPEFLTSELAAIHEIGGHDVTLVENTPNFNLGPSIKFPDQAQFHPAKYLNGLTQVIENLGGRIFSHTVAREIVGGENAHVKTENGCTVHAGHIVVATNVPVNNIVTTHTRLIAYRSYCIAVEIPFGSVPDALLWDTADPYHYVRVFRDAENRKDFLIVGGADHRTGQERHPEYHYDQLKTWTREVLKTDPLVASQWSGQIIEPVDGLALIGKNPGDAENILIYSGDSGHGLTHGTIAGLLFSDLITGRPNEWKDLYDPSRVAFNWQSQATYVAENAKTAAQYFDWILPGEKASEEDIAPEEGAIIRDGLRKIAVYRDANDNLHRFSAECPHLKGIVHWNTSEKSWDCPCHGSRFDVDGKVINGPAISDLEPVRDTPLTPLAERVQPLLSTE